MRKPIFKKFSFIVLSVILCAFSVHAQESPKYGIVTDEDRLVTVQQTEYFNNLSRELFEKAGVRLYAILVDDIGKADASTAATQFTSRWNPDGNEYAVILVALKQRKKAVLAGGGAETYLQKSELEKIQQERMIPAFRKENYGQGITATAYGIAQAIAQKKGFSLDTGESDIPEEPSMTVRGWIFIIVVFGLLVIIGRKGRRFGFFDNMKKLLSVSEIEKSPWPGIFKNVFGDNLVSAFISEKCLMEGFDALASPWTINFILRDNSPEETTKLRAYEKQAHRDNLEFGHFYSLAEITGAPENAHDLLNNSIEN